MKKWMIALMMAALLIVPMGGIAYAVGEGAPAAPAAGEFIPGDVPAQSGTMDAMVAPVNALVMCMVEQGLAYNDQDDVFLWNSLYYMLSLCGQMDERAELTDGGRLRRRSVLQLRRTARPAPGDERPGEL